MLLPNRNYKCQEGQLLLSIYIAIASRMRRYPTQKLACFEFLNDQEPEARKLLAVYAHEFDRQGRQRFIVGTATEIWELVWATPPHHNNFYHACIFLPMPMVGRAVAYARRVWPVRLDPATHLVPTTSGPFASTGPPLPQVSLNCLMSPDGAPKPLSGLWSRAGLGLLVDFRAPGISKIVFLKFLLFTAVDTFIHSGMVRGD